MLVKARKLCFVLMPFKENLREVYWKAIRPACITAGFDSLRVDELKGPFNINRKIIEHIFSSYAIIADLTEWNPNVFYEMGVAHTIDNKTIMIIQGKDKLPFDVSNYYCIRYEQTNIGLGGLAHSITDALTTIGDWRRHPTNPVQDFKPYDAFIPESALSQIQSELNAKDHELARSVPLAKWEALARELSAKDEKLADLRHELTSLQAQVSRETFHLASTVQSSVILRSQSLRNISHEDVKRMLKEKNLFGNDWNKESSGIQHHYKEIKQFGQDLTVDYATALCWQQSGSDQSCNYEEAKTYIAKLNSENFGGYNDWRIPTLEEAVSLMKPHRGEDALYIDSVFSRAQVWIWTSDTENPVVTWVVNFEYGICLSRPVEDKRFVRAVRQISNH